MPACRAVSEDSVVERVIGWTESVAVIGRGLAIELDLLADERLIVHATVARAATLTPRQSVSLPQVSAPIAPLSGGPPREVGLHRSAPTDCPPPPAGTQKCR